MMIVAAVVIVIIMIIIKIMTMTTIMHANRLYTAENTGQLIVMNRAVMIALSSQF